MSRYRWALRPGWIFSHVFVGTCVLLFIWAGFWQLSRLQQRRASNQVITARQSETPVPVGEVLPVGATAAQIDDAQYRTVTVTGTYDVASQVLISNRSNGGDPGYWVVTPVVEPGGRALVVNRGFIPLRAGDGSPDLYAPPAGPVTVTGLLRDTQVQEGLAASDPPDTVLKKLSRVDVPRLQQQVGHPLYPAYIDLTVQQPPQALLPGAVLSLPQPVPPPELDDGPHLNYAEQWFIFATLTCIVYPLLLRRTAKHKAEDAYQAAYDAAHPESAHPEERDGSVADDEPADDPAAADRREPVA